MLAQRMSLSLSDACSQGKGRRVLPAPARFQTSQQPALRLALAPDRPIVAPMRQAPELQGGESVLPSVLARALPLRSCKTLHPVYTARV